jgi:hypothetical protein
MDEQIGAATIRGDEAETLFRVEPLDGALSHLKILDPSLTHAAQRAGTGASLHGKATKCGSSIDIMAQVDRFVPT